MPLKLLCVDAGVSTKAEPSSSARTENRTTDTLPSHTWIVMLVPPVIGPTGGLTSQTATRARAAALPAHATLTAATVPFCGSVANHSTAGTTGSYPAGTGQLTLQLPYAAAASSAASAAVAASGLGAGASGSPEGAGTAAVVKGAAGVAAGLGAATGPAAGLNAGLMAGLAAGLVAGLMAGPLRLTSSGAAAGRLDCDASRASTYCVSSAVDCVKLATPPCEDDAKAHAKAVCSTLG